MPKKDAAAAPAKMTLYDVALEGMQLQELLIAAEGELTPETEERLDKLMKEGPERIEAAAMVVRNLEAFEDECRAEAKRLHDRAKSFAANVERVKARMLAAVDGAFDGSVKTAKFTIWGQKSPDSVSYELSEDFTLEMLREEFPELVRTKLELNKEECKRLHDEGTDFPAAVIRNEKIGERHLRIK